MKQITNPDQSRLLKDLIIDLETFLQVKREIVSIEEIWNKNPPAEAKGQLFAEFMKLVRLNSPPPHL